MYKRYRSLADNEPTIGCRRKKERSQPGVKALEEEKPVDVNRYADIWKKKVFTYGKELRRKPAYERDEEKRKPKEKPKRRTQPKPAPPPKPEPLPEEEPAERQPAERLLVTETDLHIRENTLAHHTNKYYCTQQEDESELVVRRGQPIKLSVSFDKAYDLNIHDVDFILELTATDQPKPNKGTHLKFVLDESGKETFDDDEWGASLISRSGNNLTMNLYSPSNCIVGEWLFTVRTYCKGVDEEGEDTVLVYQYPVDYVTILFNPWCPDDQVYMADTNLLKEYILNESGCVYRGNSYHPSAKAWNFAQFEREILDTALYLLRLSFSDGRNVSQDMADPIQVSRKIAAVVNEADEGGVLVGNWSGDYSGGTPPTKWAGSGKILRQFMATNEPVKYGQCWVFSCVTTTVCRTLGIPCRSVTNFSSAHDTDKSLTIDKYFTMLPDNSLEPEDSSDSVWNFHVWNEVFLENPEFSSEYDGWSVIDSTPQEESDGKYTCGPCPVMAVKKGECDKGYDTGFVFAEVNADRVHWAWSPETEELTRIKLETRSVGKNISTKIPDGHPYNGRSDDSRLDLTLNYKFKEDSVEERLAVIKANKTAKNPSTAYTFESEHADIDFTFSADSDPHLGDDLTVTLAAHNIGDTDRVIKQAKISVKAETYSGEVKDLIKTEQFHSIQVEQGKEIVLKLTVSEAEYVNHLVEQANILLECSAVVERQNERHIQIFSDIRGVRFRRPDLKVKGPDEVKLGEMAEFTVSFRNPSSVSLTNCDISFESSGFLDDDDIKVGDVPARGKFSTTVKGKAVTDGEHNIGFVFDCKQLPDIEGSKTVVIED